MCRPDARLSRSWRPWAVSLAVFCVAAGCGPLVNVVAYERQPIYDTAQAMMPWEAWAALWLAAATSVGVAAVTLSAWAWRFGTTVAIACGCAWLTAILWEHYVDGVPISPTGMGLWSWFVASNLIASTNRTQFEGRDCVGCE